MMTVYELIEELKDCNPNDEVSVRIISGNKTDVYSFHIEEETNSFPNYNDDTLLVVEKENEHLI